MHSITDAHEAASIESHQRIRAYVIKMAFRVVFFLSGALLAHAGHLWWGLALLAIATILPWMAVMGANLIKDSPAPPGDVTFVDGPLLDQLGTGSGSDPGSGSESESESESGRGADPRPDGGVSGSRAGLASGDGSGVGHGTRAGADAASGGQRHEHDTEHKTEHETISGEWLEEPPAAVPGPRRDREEPHE